MHRLPTYFIGMSTGKRQLHFAKQNAIIFVAAFTLAATK